MINKTRLVLIDKASQTYQVYEGIVKLATYIATKDSPVTKEELEEIRTAVYPQKA